MKEETLNRFKETHIVADEASRRLHEALDNLISSSDLNDRRYEVRGVGSLDDLRRERDRAWDDYRRAEDELITELNAGLFPGEHRAG